MFNFKEYQEIVKELFIKASSAMALFVGGGIGIIIFGLIFNVKDLWQIILVSIIATLLVAICTILTAGFFLTAKHRGEK